MAVQTTRGGTPPSGHLRLHVAVGPECNNNCLFCMEEDRYGRRMANAALTPQHIRALLEQSRGMPEVCFTSGEPTLVDALPRYIGWARELGFERISVSTNGRRLSYAPYCRALVRAGVSLFYISVHGHTDKLHDSVTRTPGSFEQTLAGLRNAAALGRVEVQSCSVVTTRNVGQLEAIYAFLREAGADQVVFNAMQPNGRADTHFEQIFPRYAAVVESFASLLESLDGPRAPVYLVDVPPCMTEGLPDHNRGWVEGYVHHEVAGAEDKDAPPARGDALLERCRADMEQARRSEGPPCAQCTHATSCRGVWNNYLSRHGWDEFHPVTRP